MVCLFIAIFEGKLLNGIMQGSILTARNHFVQVVLLDKSPGHCTRPI